MKYNFNNESLSTKSSGSNQAIHCINKKIKKENKRRTKLNKIRFNPGKIRAEKRQKTKVN